MHRETFVDTRSVKEDAAMGLFNDLMNKIFHHAPAAHAAPAAPAAPAASPAGTARPNTAPSAPVDVAAVLDHLAAQNPQKLDWRHSIVDLMKLVGMDSSFGARKALAAEMGYSGDSSDSAAMNIWLHKKVMEKLAENGGKVPQELLH